MPLATGQVLQNRYRIARLIGEGGFGAVYRAWDLSLNKLCALKENLDISEEARRQFQREATLMSTLVHPSLPRVTDHFVIPDQGQYLVMDYVEGQSLNAILDEQNGPIDEKAALAWIEQICDALDYLHTRNPPIIHRDIKPENIIITPEGRAMLVDFGISKIYDPALQTTIGAKAVTPGYSPPEQYGGGTTDARADVYALGATLYRLLTNQDPPESVQRMVGATSLIAPRMVNKGLSVGIENVILQATQVNTTQRFQSVAEMRAAMTALTSGNKDDGQKKKRLPIWLWLIFGLLAACLAGWGALNGMVAPTVQVAPSSTATLTPSITPSATNTSISLPASAPLNEAASITPTERSTRPSRTPTPTRTRRPTSAPSRTPLATTNTPRAAVTATRRTVTATAVILPGTTPTIGPNNTSAPSPNTPLPLPSTNTPLPPPATNTPFPPAATNTPFPPAATNTPLPPPPNPYPAPPTNTPLPPATNTPNPYPVPPPYP
jgi:eukaryotic-like serine/threonine-protein kinase